jgi:hypothetical protein
METIFEESSGPPVASLPIKVVLGFMILIIPLEVCKQH